MPFDRDIFFDMVRDRPFGGSLTQQQVDGMSDILDVWENGSLAADDRRWLANAMAQAFHETGGKMWPIAEYQGAQQPYGQPDPVTGQRYYGRGLIQCTHKENYARADKELGLTGANSCVAIADNMLRPDISAATMFQGMIEGWFRSSGGVPNTLAKYFNDTRNDVFEAREIVNGDKNTVPSWSNGVSIGKLIEGYHNDFLAALDASWVSEELPPELPVVHITIDAPAGVRVRVTLNQETEDAF